MPGGLSAALWSIRYLLFGCSVTPHPSSRIYSLAAVFQDGNPNLLTPLRVGQDPSFDRLLTSLASVARHCPKIVIDAIMSWRNYKNDTPFQITSNLSVSYSHIKQRDLEILLAERKTLILNFIICRVLITIMGSLTKELLPESLGEKLEAMVFEQIKIADPEIISRNPNRQSNIDFFAELLGSISNLRFGSVSDHFASELARSSSLKESKLEMIIRQMRHLRLKIVPMEAIEDSAFFLETCAKYFQATGASRIQLAFADTFVELLEPIVEVVTGVINIPAWIKAIESIYGKAYRPNQRLKGTLVRAVCHLFLVTTLLSACKKSFFYDNWMSAANMCLQRLSQRDYKNKLSVLFCLVRLIWIYLYRFPETPVHNAHMNLETIVRILLPSLPGRKPNAVSTTLFSTEIGPPSAMINMGPLSVSGIGGLDLYVQIAAYPGSSLGSAEEYPGSGADVSLYPDRFIIAIRTMRLLLADFEEHLGTDERSVFYNNPAAGGFSHNVVLESRINIPPPRFPAFNQFFNIQLGTTESLRAIRERKDPQASPGEIDLDSAQARGPELSKLLSASLPNHVYNGIGTMLQQTYNKINDILGRAWVEFDSGSSFDSAVGLHLLGDLATSGLHRDGSSSNLGAFAASKSSISGSGSGSGAAAEGAFSGASSDKYERPGLFVDKLVLYELMRACLDAIPRFVPTGVGPVKIIENLGRWMVHVDEDIRKAAFEALMRIAMIKDGGLKGQWALKGGETLLSGILRIAVDTSIGIVNEKFGELATMQGTHDAVYSIMEKVVCNYICFLKLYLEEMKELHGREDSRLEPAHVDWIVQGIESKGLLFLTSTFPAIRKHAIGILEIAVTIENVLKYGSASATDDARKARQSNANDDKVRVHPHSQSQPAQLTPKESRAIRVLQTMGDEIVRKYEYDPLSNPRSGSDGAGIDPGRGAVDRSPTLLAVAGSAAPVDVSLWNRCFAAVVAMFYDYLCPSVVIRTFADINVRLGALYPTISSGLDLSFKLTSNGTLQWNTVSTPSNLAQVPSRAVLPSDEIVVQFQLYLTFVVATMEVVSSESIGHIGKLSPGNDCHHNVYPVFGSRVLRWEVDDTIWRRPVAVRIEQPQSIIHKAFSLILSDRVHIRNASIIAFGSMHWRTYRTFLEEIRPCGKLVMDDIRQRIATNPQTPSHSTRKLSLSSASQHTRKLDRLREELTQIFSLIAHFVDHDEYRQDHELVAPVLQYIKDMQRFLHHPEIQSDLDYQMLRYYFCGFIERFFDHLVTSLDVAMDVAMDASGNRLSDEKLENYISIDQRYALFLMFEQWCGHGPLAASIREHEDKTIKALLDGIRDQRDRAMTHDRIELQRNALELASLKAMSSLCRGSITNARHPRVSFDVRTLLAWVDGLLTSSNDKHHAIARVALENLLLYNRSNEELFENVLLRCHSSTVPHDVQRGYFMAMVNLFGSPAQNHFYTTSQRKYLRERKLNDLPFHPAKLLCLAMYMIGSHSLQIRKAAIRLLLGVEGLMGDSAPAYPPDVKGYTMYPGGPGESAYAQPLDLGDDEEDATNEAAAITSALPAIFKRAQAAVSCRLASEYTEITYEMLSEMIIQTEMIRKGGPPTYYNPNLRDIFIAMLPWIRNIDLPNVMNDVENMKETPVPPKSLAKVTSEVILTNLLYITIRYGDDFINEIEDIWAQLVDRFEEDAPYADNQTAPAGAAASALSYEKMSRNVQMIVEFLLDVGVQRRSRKFVKYAKKIVVYLGRTAGCEQLVETLMSWITPKGLVPSSGDRNLGGIDDDISEMLSFGKSGREVGGTYIQGVGPNPLFMVDLGDVLNDSQLPRQFSRGQLSCVLLVDLAIECGHNVLESRLPTLLLVIFVQLDHPLTLIVEESRLLLINLIHSILPRDQNADRIDAIHSTLNLKEGKRLWNYEDVSPKIPAIDSERQMAGLLSDVLALFSSVDPQIKQHLGETALQWGARRTLRHVAARSLQIFRALLPPFSLKMIGELLYRLHCTIGSPVDEYQGYSLELLNTLQVMIDTLDPARLLLYPQLFWAAVACMQSPNEFEFIRGVHMLNKITGKIGIEEEQCRNILILSLPGNWRGQFHGLQPLLARGLCSSVAETEAVEVLGHLLTFADDALVDQPSERVLRSILCFLPRLLQGLEAAPQADGGADVNISVEGCLRVASLLGMMADRKGHFGLGKLFLSYSKQRFRSKEDFLSQLVSLIRNEFCPTHEGMVLQTLLKHLTNRHPFYRKRTLKFLK
ncbi:cell morphogenesis N-terminal-domain-containing protein, partial [Polychytrium aggregatum]|uniref:cell morphogenesis N-terminal-domain-containing protein n=1 Tax=Polychytrium aggregatum TaxID=110093 RepID=UPI0022FF17AD